MKHRLRDTVSAAEQSIGPEPDFRDWKQIRVDACADAEVEEYCGYVFDFGGCLTTVPADSWRL